MFDSRNLIEQEFKKWRATKQVPNEQTPERLWAMLCAHISVFGEAEVLYFARKLGLSWAKLKGKSLNWQNDCSRESASRTANQKGLVTSTQEDVTCHEGLNTTDNDLRGLVNKRKRKLRRTMVGENLKKNINVTRISLTDLADPKFERKQSFHGFSCTSPDKPKDVSLVSFRNHQISGVVHDKSAAPAPPSLCGLAVIAFDKIQMTLQPGQSISTLAEIFTEICIQMGKRGEYNGSSSSSDNGNFCGS